MIQRFSIFLMAAMCMATLPVWAQQPCPTFEVTVNSAEDQLVLAINGADKPEDQLAALDTFVKDHPDSKFMPCVNEYYASVNVKLKDYDKAIEYGEKDLTANYQDLNLLFSLMRAYASSTQVSDTFFDVIDNRVPAQAKVETASPQRPSKATDEEWAKIQKESQDLAKDSHDYAVWAFFQVAPRVTDPAKQIQVLDAFIKAYPDEEKNHELQLDTMYFADYQKMGNLEKTVEYGDKVIAADPNNVAALNTLGLIYAFYAHPASVDKGAAYAQKALAAAQALKKPEGMDDAAFKKGQATQIGMANLTLGYTALIRAEKSGKLIPAINELKLASTLLEGNPALQGQALYFLAYAYERGYPPNHRGAMEALEKAVTLPGPMQGQARDLLAKVRAAVK
jgi:tetratricopeptide (TPR) repeat protein